MVSTQTIFVFLSSLCSFVAMTTSLPDGLGFDLSVGLQGDPLSASAISDITSGSLLNGVKYYKFYGWSTDHDVATSILSKASNPGDIKFYIEILPGKVNNLQNSDIADLVAEWDDLKSYIYCIALGNEPVLNDINFWVIPTKLQMVYDYLATQSGWDNIKVSVPFSQNIFEVTYPVASSTFKSEYKSYLTSMIGIYQQYGAPFSINLYPFFAASSLPDLMDFLLGEESAAGDYGSMLEQMYDCTLYAMEDAVSNHGVEIVVTETGWSSYSSYSFATVSNANAYTENALRLMDDASSHLYGKKVFWFELFDEDLKSGGDWEQHFGWYDQYGTLKLSITSTDSDNTPSPTTSPVSSGSDCGYVPSSCDVDLSWAVSSGTSQYPENYPDFEGVTGVELTSATSEDMVLFWHCTDRNPNGNCGGLQIPCGRSCYPTPTTTASCGNVPDSCTGDLEWAASTGTKSNPQWYPYFESVTGVSLSAAGTDDVQLYWFCEGDPTGNCGGLEAPCGRSCGGSSPFTADDEEGGVIVGNLVWILIAVTVLIGVVVCGVTVFCVRRKNKKALVSVGDDDVTLRDDQQLREVNDQTIELEESVEREDGAVTV